MQAFDLQVVPFDQVLAQDVVYGAQLRDFGVAFDVEVAVGAALDVQAGFQYAALEGDLRVGADVGLDVFEIEALEVDMCGDGAGVGESRALRMRRAESLM